MRDKADERLDRLFATARAERPDTSALEEHFETRLMARISEQRSESIPWYALAWRMLPLFTMIAATITVVTFTFTPSRSNDLFAALTGDQDEVASSSYLIGE